MAVFFKKKSWIVILVYKLAKKKLNENKFKLFLFALLHV